MILIGTGSELQLALEAQEKLAAEGVKARVVSMPCWDLFDDQSAEYKESVLPSAVRARVAVEAGTPIGWERYVGLEGQSRGAKAVRRLSSGERGVQALRLYHGKRGGARQGDDCGSEGPGKSR